jgi:hypothetical protein
MRVYSLIPGKLEGDTDAVTNTLPIFGFKALVLFDLGATHSFVYNMFVKLSRLSVRPLEFGLVVATPAEETVVRKRVVCGRPVSIYGRILPANLVVLALQGYDVILGMDSLTKHYASIDCVQKQVMLKPWGEVEVTFVRSKVKSLPSSYQSFGLGSSLPVEARRI